jgi:hypothetical protein
MFVRKRNIKYIRADLVILIYILCFSLVSTTKTIQANLEKSPSMPNRDTIASAISQANSVSFGVEDATSKTKGEVSSESTAQSTALNGGQAKSQALSNSSSESSAVKNSIATSNSDSKAISKALTFAGNADSIADSKSKASSQATNNSETLTNSASNVNSQSSSIGGNNYYLGNPINIDNKKIHSPLINTEISGLVEQIKNDNSSNQIKTDDYLDWEDIYKQTNPDRYHHKKFANINLINLDYDANNFLPSLNLPVQTELSKGSSVLSFSSAKVKWTYTNFVGLDIAMDSQGNAIAVGLDGAVYEYNWNENVWSKIEGDFEMKSGMRVALGWEQSPFVVSSGGETYYLTCGHKWEKLPGCARDIAVGMGGEVYKIGCERRPGGFRIYKLVCNYDKEKCKPCSRWRNKSNKVYTYDSDNKKCNWFNVNGSGVRIAVHPNGRPFVINDRGAIQFYDGKDWQIIPQTSALDLSLSNEGIIVYVGSDYGVYRLYPGKYSHDYTKVDFMKLLDRSAISIASGPYAHPMIISEEYKVFTSSK